MGSLKRIMINIFPRVTPAVNKKIIPIEVTGDNILIINNYYLRCITTIRRDDAALEVPYAISPNLMGG